MKTKYVIIATDLTHKDRPFVMWQYDNEEDFNAYGNIIKQSKNWDIKISCAAELRT